MRDAVSRQLRRHRPGNCNRLVSRLGDWYPGATARAQSCATSTQPAGGMRRATLAGSAGIQITRRTARTYWEHRPRWVSRDDIEPSFPKSVSITSREGRMRRANPSVPRAHGALRPCGYGGPHGGGWGRTLAQRPGLHRTSKASGRAVDAPSYPGARRGRGRLSPHTRRARWGTRERDVHEHRQRGGAGGGARIHNPLDREVGSVQKRN